MYISASPLANRSLRAFAITRALIVTTNQESKVQTTKGSRYLD
jgi:hypothetical protein